MLALRHSAACLVLAASSSSAALAQAGFDCGTELLQRTPSIVKPGDLELPGALPKAKPGAVGPCLSADHVFLFPDSAGVLSDPDHTGAELLALKVAAANAVIAEHGDEFDFFGFWTNLEPAKKFGGAHYNSVRNDAEGIGLPLFDNHAAFGLDGSRTLGFLMMYDFHLRRTKTARNALLHEFAHRWMAYLDPLLDGRSFGSAHFNCLPDMQGGILGSEWKREDPAHPSSGVTNTDTGTRFGWLQLYLMGLASESEMDDGMHEQRYMNDVDVPNGGCQSNYRGVITTWSAADIIASNGPRLPAPGASQEAFRTAWVLLHPPGELPLDRDLRRLLRILQRLQSDWVEGTLGRSTMEGQLFPDCDCDGLADDVDPDPCP